MVTKPSWFQRDKTRFVKCICIILLVTSLMILASPVKAETCSFINITQGEQGIQGIQGIPGMPGVNGTAATIAVGTVISGTPASVTNVGTSQDAIFDFVLPKGDTGAAGVDGDDGYTPVFGVDYFNGSDGAPGYTPQFGVDYFNGSNGTNGSNGEAATIAINNTVTLNPGSSATVTNIGSSSAALFDFGIPAGATGETGAANMTAGPQGEQGIPGAANMTAGPQGEKGDKGDPGEVPDVTQFLFINGTRAMTGNLSMSSQYITGLHDPSISTDAATKGYVDSRPDSTYNESYWTGTNYNASYWTGTNYNSSYLTSGDLSAYATTTYVGQVNTSMKNYVDSGLPYVASGNSSLVLTSNLSYALDSEVSAANTSMKNYVDARPDSTYNASYLTSTDLTGYATESYVGEQGYITSTYNTSYDPLIRSDYVYTGNGSYLLGSNASIATTTYVGQVNTSMKNYVDSGLPYVASNNGTLVLTTNGSYLLGSNTSIATTTYVGQVNTSMKNYVDSRPDSTYNASYLTSSYNSTYDAKPDSTYNSTYHGLIRTDYVYTGNTSYVLTSNTTYALDSEVSAANTSMKNYVDSGLPYVASNNGTLVLTSNATYLLTGGSRAMSGNLSMGSHYINNLITGSLGTDAVNRSFVTGQGYITSTYNATYDSKPSSTYNSTYDAKPSSTYNATYDAKPSSTYNSTYDAKAPAAVYGYTTLMAGSAMITTTNPATMTQTETSTNKNNYITVDFTDGGSEVGMWITDFPADWNYSAPVTFTPVWTATSGSGTVRFDVSAKLFPDDAALDTALGSIGASLDTLIATGDVHVSDSAVGAITSVGTGGNTAIIKVVRNSAVDSLSGTARLIALRVKYSRILA